MRTWTWILGSCLVCACSANAVGPARSGGSAPAAGSGAATPKSDNPGSPQDPGGGLVAMAPAPSPHDAGIVADGCQVGQFCKPLVPDPDNCGTLTLGQDIQIKHIPGNLLLVFDQSLSMSEPWGTTGQTKLLAAQTAIKNAITSLQDSLTVGALFFPTAACAGGPGGLGRAGLPGGPAGVPGGPGLPAGPGGLLGMRAVEPIDGQGQIPFAAAPQFIQSWDQHWNSGTAGLGIGTPMQEAFDRADEALAAAKLVGDIAVVAVTDGEPNCFPNSAANGGTATDLETNRAKNWLAARGVKTYVVGLPGAAGVQLLNDVAMQGGTMQYILPDDPKMLEDRLRTLVQETMKTSFDSCSIHLTPAADPADKLLMVVVEAKDNSKHQVPHTLTPSAGWTITPDGTQVEITGDLCSDAKNGRFTSITFQYPCKNSVPLTPLQPM